MATLLFYGSAISLGLLAGYGCTAWFLERINGRYLGNR